MRQPRVPVRVQAFGVMTIAMLAAVVVVAPLRDGGAAAQAGPHNDNFNRSEFISVGQPIAQSTAGATLEAGETAPCAEIGASVWFVFVPPASGTYEVDTAGSDFDTVVTVYTMENFVPSPPGGSLTPVVCAAGGSGAGARVSFSATGGRMYSIQAAGLSGATGNLRIEARCTPACPPPNDSLVSALRVRELPFTHELSTTGATLEPDELQPCGDVGATVWYRMASDLPSEPIDVTVDATTSGFPVAVALYDPGSPSPPGGIIPIDCTDSGVLSFTLAPGDRVLLQVGGVGGAVGALNLNVTCHLPSCPLVSDPVPVETGDGAIPVPVPGGGGDPVSPPGTGNGGYLPSRR